MGSSSLFPLSLYEMLWPYRSLILPLFFIGFFFALFVAITFYRHKYIRKTYVAGFFIGLLFFSTVSPVVLLPYIQQHKFSDPRPQDQTYYETRVVDAHGEELVYDKRAPIGSDSVDLQKYEKAILQEQTTAENCEVMGFLLYRAKEHRERVQDRQFIHHVRFPEHGMSGAWTEHQVTEYAEFTGIRLYQVNVSTSDDGAEITSHSEDRVIGYYEDTMNGRLVIYQNQGAENRLEKSSSIPCS